MVGIGRRDYRRWEYEDETEISMEEQLRLDDHDHDHGRETPTSTTTFSQPTIILTASQNKKQGRKKTCRKGKIQLVFLSGAVLLAGFTIGFSIGVHEKGKSSSRSSDSSNLDSGSAASLQQSDVTDDERRQETRLSNEEKNSDYYQPTVQNLSPAHDANEPSFRKLFLQLSADNIRHNLRRMTQEPHPAGSPEGKSMAIAIRDLWRSFGLSVRVEQHKAIITTSKGVNLVEVVDRNGSVLFTTHTTSSNTETDSTSPGAGLANFRPVIAFSPAANLSGTLIYGLYGRTEDLDFLRRSNIVLNGSILLVRFSSAHPSIVSAVASSYGIKGIIFFADPKDMGPLFPSTAIRWSSLASLENIHEVQKHRGKFLLPAHSISYSDAEQLLRWIRQSRASKKAPQTWQGGLKTSYYLGPAVQGSSLTFSVRLRTFNEPKSSSIFNVVGSIPGGWESDRYVVIGCSHDSHDSGAGDPGIGLAVLTEIAQKFSQAVQKGWRPRRSILFISWDANLYASTGVLHWLQEHHFEISTRAIAYIDLTRILRGNQTLSVFSSPLLREIARKAIARVKHSDSFGGKSNGPPIHFSSVVSPDEPSFAFFGNLGIPFIRICVSNSPKGNDYPLFHTSLDTFENFVKLVDPTLKGAETLGRIISEVALLLADSTVLPINVEDYVVEIQTAFTLFMSHYQQDLHRANLQIAYLQAAVMRLEVIGDNFHTDMHNRSVINTEHELIPSPTSPSHNFKIKKPLLHRIMNDKLMEVDRTFLSRSSEAYKHQILGFTSTVDDIPVLGSGSSDLYQANNMSLSLQLYFPKLRQYLDCGRKAMAEIHLRSQSSREFGRGANLPNARSNYPLNEEDAPNEFHQQGLEGTFGKIYKDNHSRIYPFPLNYRTSFITDTSTCHDWRYAASQKIASLTRALDATSAVLQSPLLPEEEY